MASRTADFFENGTAGQFEFVLTKYDETLRAKAESKNSKSDTLLKLDKWFQNELPKKIKSRGKEAHLTHDELVQTIKWKLARGKFRPRLKDMVQMNTPRVVKQETSKAFRNLFKRNDLEASISALCNLKGVGPAMASAVLAAAAPEMAPFMADECLLSMPDIEGIDYTMKEYMKYVEKTKACVERLNACSEGNTWTPHRVELAVWTHYVAYDLKPELLNDLPSRHPPPAPGINGDASNGETNGLNGAATPVSEVSPPDTPSESDSNSCPPPDSLPETPPEASFAAEPSFAAAEPSFGETEAGKDETAETTEKDETPENAPSEEVGGEAMPENSDATEDTAEKPAEETAENTPKEVEAAAESSKDVETVVDTGGEKKECEKDKDPPTNGVNFTKESSDSESTNGSVPQPPAEHEPSFQNNDTTPQKEPSPPADLPESLPPTKRPAEQEEEEERQIKRLREESDPPVPVVGLSTPPVIHAGGD